ncbi:MAG: SDR family NAD(P)-dependent oxidoreductase, partial [Eubacteriales bacterium]|nr:SDR family NAD(P)-dependent oxidoreductase [Eubacteriales bacterium]
MEQIAIVTGGTGGIGLATAQALRQAGVKVYVLSRKPGGDSTFAHLCADVSDEGQVRRAVEEVLSREGKIDLLVNCAGFGISGAVEFTGSADAHRQMEVNLFGTDNLCRAIL